MKYIEYQDIDSFLEIILPVLLENEVENNLILGVALTLKNNPEIYKEKYLAAVVHDEEIQVVAVCTPPRKLLLYSKNKNANDHFKLIIENMLKSYYLSGVLAPKDTALSFAKVWQQITCGTFKPGMSERIYKLETVSFPPKVPGSMRIAQEGDFDMICRYIEAFHHEAVPDDPLKDVAVFARRKIEKGEIAVWEHEHPVSIIAKARPTLNGICVNMVYSPPEQREKGYASNLVATFSQSLLDEGWKFCTLFTDLSNPTSNSIYQKIGYRPVCDFQEYTFIT